MNDLGMVGWTILKVSVMAGCLLAMGWPAYRVICLCLDRAISVGEMVVALTLLVLMMMGVMTTFGTPLGWLLLLLFFLVCGAVAWLNYTSDQSALKRMEDEDLRKYLRELEIRPQNSVIRERLARTLLKRGHYEEALAQVKEGLNYEPMLRSLQVLHERIETEWRREATHAKMCPKCFNENPSDASVCRTCGFYFLDPGDFVRLLGSPPALEAFKWGGMALGVAGLTLLLAKLQLGVGAFLLLLGVGAGMWYLQGQAKH